MWVLIIMIVVSATNGPASSVTRVEYANKTGCDAAKKAIDNDPTWTLPGAPSTAVQVKTYCTAQAL
jgi:hypothetical protein